MFSFLFFSFLFFSFLSFFSTPPSFSFHFVFPAGAYLLFYLIGLGVFFWIGCLTQCLELFFFYLGSFLFLSFFSFLFFSFLFFPFSFLFLFFPLPFTSLSHFLILPLPSKKRNFRNLILPYTSLFPCRCLFDILLSQINFIETNKFSPENQLNHIKKLQLGSLSLFSFSFSFFLSFFLLLSPFILLLFSFYFFFFFFSFFSFFYGKKNTIESTQPHNTNKKLRGNHKNR